MRRFGMMIAGSMLAVSLLAPPGAGASGGAADPARPGGATGGAARVEKRALADVNIEDWIVPGELVVQFKSGVKRVEARGLHRAMGSSRLDTMTGLGPRFEHVRIAPGLSTVAAARAYRKDPRVLVAEPNLRLQRFSHVPATPNDTDWAHLWGLNNTGQPHNISDPLPTTSSGASDADINAPAAWATEQGHSSQTIVGVVDTGAQVTHPDIDGNLWSNPGETPGNGVDDDGNGCIDDVNGRNFGGNGGCADLSNDDLGGHGQHVAGTIAAEGHNSTGIVGVCPHCEIMVLKFGFTTADEVKAYAYAKQKGADVINGSFGGPIFSLVERNAIKALKNAGILAVYAAANDSLDNDLPMRNTVTGGFSPAFPASYNLPGIIAVAASNHDDEYGYFTGCVIAGLTKRQCGFSNVGHDSVDVFAPGVDIRSTIPGSIYDEYNGTSMAAPHVAGLAGLITANNPALTPVQVKNKIMNGVDTPASLKNAYLAAGNASGNFTRTDGRIDAAASLGAPTTNATPKTDGNTDGAKGIRRTKRGGVAYPNDVNDVYKKRLQKGKIYVAKLVVPSGKDFDLWVWLKGIKEIHQLESGCYGLPGPCRIVGVSAGGSGVDEVVKFKATKAGVFFFQVQAWFKQKGGYKLIVKMV